MAKHHKDLPKETIRAIRTLDLEWAHRTQIEWTGQPFFAAYSEVTGVWMTADEIALMSLHKMRTQVGNKKEARESKEWLRSRGLKGLFEQPLDLH